MAPLALVLVGHIATGSFATGAIMASAYTLAEALSAPAAGRRLGAPATYDEVSVPPWAPPR